MTLVWILAGFAVLIVTCGVIVYGGSWWEHRHPDPDLTVEPLRTAWIIDECGECGLPIYSSDSRCTIGKITEDATGGTGSSAAFHDDCCPDTGSDHEHGTTTVRVGSAP